MNLNLRVILLILLGVILVVFVANQIIFTKLQKGFSATENNSSQLKHKFYYNEAFVHDGSNYPVCSKLDALRTKIDWLDKNKLDLNDLFEQLLKNRKLNCGNHRTEGGLSKSVIVSWKSECVAEILPAQDRLFQYLHNLCNTQAFANEHCKSDLSSNTATTGNAFSNRHTNLKHKSHDKCIDKLLISKSFTDQAVSRRGVIYTGKIKHFKNIYQSVLALRAVRSLLPVEVWVNSFAMPMCTALFMRTPHTRDKHHRVTVDPVEESSQGLFNVRCRQFDNDIVSFASKFYALLYTDFEEVLFMDADNLAVRDVGEVFESEGYLATGAVLWPDVWSSACPEDAVDDSRLSGTVGRPNFVMFAANFSDLRWSLTREYAQETEAGQMVLDLRRHRGLVNLGRRMHEDGDFFRRVFNGDKDIFRFVFLLTHTPFHYVDRVPGYSVDDLGRRDCLVHYHDMRSRKRVKPPKLVRDVNGSVGVQDQRRLLRWYSDSHGVATPLFFHQFKTRSPSAFRRYVRNLPSTDADPAVCLPINMQLDSLAAEDVHQKQWGVSGERQVVRSRVSPGDLYVIDTPKEGAALKAFAEKLFASVDKKWESLSSVHWLEWYIFAERYVVYLPLVDSFVLFVVIVYIVSRLVMFLRR